MGEPAPGDQGGWRLVEGEEPRQSAGRLLKGVQAKREQAVPLTPATPRSELRRGPT